MLGSPATPAAAAGGGVAGARGLWPLAPAPAPTEPYSRYGVYSLFPGAGSPAPGLGVAQALYHATHKVSDSLFSSANYTATAFGAPTPPPGSPYSPVPVSQLELLTKGISTSLATAIINNTNSTPISNSKNIVAPNKRCCWLKPSCGCQAKATIKPNAGGCSRTNPLDWQGGVQVKREASTPCQVAEITTSEVPVGSGSSAGNGIPQVKVEAVEESVGQDSRTQGPISVPVTNGNIPVGIAVARQRLQQDFSSSAGLPSTPSSVLSHTPQPLKDMTRISDIDPSSVGGVLGLSGGGSTGGVLQCGDDRGLAAWPMGGAGAHAAPTMWQYPASMPIEPMLPLPIPMPPLGYQLVRDPSSGHFLLIPTASLEQLGQAVVWPTYPQPSSHVLLPPLPPPPPLAPLQLLSSTSASTDYLTTSTTLHQHTQTHSTRLVAVTGPSQDKNRPAKGLPTVSVPLPLPLPAHTLIKIEADCTATATALDASSGQAHAPFVLYQHPNLILQPPQTADTPTQVVASVVPTANCKSQATSPVTCLTPPPENMSSSIAMSAVQDASNQTDHPVQEEDKSSSTVIILPEPSESTVVIPQAETEVKSEFKTSPNNKPDPDISGLELLSNSIVEFENSNRKTSSVKYESSTTEKQQENGDDVLTGIAHMTLKDCEAESQVSPTEVDDNLGGLSLLCALAEQRIMEEVGEQRREKRKPSKTEPLKEPKIKRPKHDVDRDLNENERELERERLSVLKKVANERGLETETNNNCNCKDNNNSIDSKPMNWSPAFMSAVERDMRQELADLQRKCKEKKLELSKLAPPQIEISVKPTQELLKPPVFNVEEPSHKRKLSLSQDSSDSTSTTPEKISSSKKRKVGRPKKLMSAPGLRVATTETIVAKKPRAKAGLVGYILAAKNRLQMQNKSGLAYRESTPPRYSEDSISSPSGSPAKTKNAKNLDKNRSKIRPKLKAEATLKIRNDEADSSSDSSDTEQTPTEISSQVIPQTIPDTQIQITTSEPPQEDEDVEEENLDDAVVEREISKRDDVRCVLTAQHLSVDKLRVLTAMGGLFYAGQLTAVRAPDVYAITLDGERGNRPHIMSREEILRDAIVEVSPTSTSELIPGTRLCAYWSQQYRCLYPGTVADPGSPDPQLDLKFVCVEFDDGDSGRIALEDIRLLPTDYPIIEYDPNPLLSLSKRRRRTSVNSVTEERRLNPQKTTPLTPPTQPTPLSSIPEPPKLSTPQAEKENTDINRQVDQDAHRERKKMKKRRKDKLKKLLSHEDKKKKRKHRCCDEKCKHRKHHKKHRKHKKHHHSRSEVEDNQEIVEQLPLVVEPEIAEKAVEEEEEEEENIVPKRIENKTRKLKNKERRESVESRSKMAAFLPARQLWSWSGRGYKRVGTRGRARKQFFKAIQRGKESIMVGDCAVFLSTGRPDRPYIGKIEAMWESWGTNMVVKVKWFYHPEETIGCPLNLKYPGALFESPHVDENDVQTISHKCEVLPLKDYTEKLGSEPQRYETIYDNNDIYYQAGYYDPTTTTLTMAPEIPFAD